MSELWSAGPGAFLGINYSGMHDSSVCLADADGQPVYAVSEERFSRVKQDGRFPYKALATVDLGRVAAIGVPYLDPSPDPVPTHPVFRPLLHPAPHRPVLPYPPLWRERLETLGRPLVFFDHHEMHAYTGFVLSGYEEALALTADYGAYNCTHTAGAFHLRKGRTTLLAGASMSEHEALAALYTDVTALLGFTPCKHEGKVTGLAAHGRPSENCKRQLWQTHQRIRADQHRLYDWVGFMDEGVPPFYEPNRHLVARYRAELPYGDEELARAAQDLLEEKMLAVAEWLAAEHGRDLPLILSGGVFANVRANLALTRVGFSKVFVAPPMGDDGLSIGAAAAVGHCTGERQAHSHPVSPPRRLPHAVSLGPKPDAGKDVEKHLKELGVVHRVARQPATTLSRRLADGHTVAVVRGRQEFGPRALGQRSILSEATTASVNDRLNAQLMRSEFMPFAPVLRMERLHDVFDLSGIGSDVSDCLPFMTLCLPVRPAIHDIAPAVVHVDGTARPQVVTMDDNPFIHEVLRQYEELTGVPVLINTSFNFHNEPLVSNVDDALAAFFAAGLDVLSLDDNILVDLADNLHLSRFTDVVRRTGGDVAKARHAALNESFGRQMVCGPGRFSELSDTSEFIDRN